MNFFGSDDEERERDPPLSQRDHKKREKQDQEKVKQGKK
jgi:hypothetical protein